MMKEIQLTCYYKKGEVDKAATLLKNANFVRIKQKADKFEEVKNQPSPQDFYRKDPNFVDIEI